MGEVIRVLVADDHPVVRRGLRATIEEESDLNVECEASDGNQALAEILDRKPDVAILDIDMPGKNGLSVAREAIEQNSAVRIIFMTFHADEDLMRAAMDAGGRGYLLKGSETDEVAAAVRAVYAGRTYIGSVMAALLLKQNGSGQNRVDNGVDTRVALNLQGDVVEVHRVRNEGILHYTRGTINTNQGKIYFNDKPRLDNEGLGHSVALRDDSYLVETESSSGNLFYRTGMLNTTDLARVDWTDRARMFPRISTEKDRSSVAVNATWAVVTFEADNKLYCTTARVP